MSDWPVDWEWKARLRPSLSWCRGDGVRGGSVLPAFEGLTGCSARAQQALVYRYPDPM